MSAFPAVIHLADDNLFPARCAVTAGEDERLPRRVTPGTLKDFRFDDTDGHAETFHNIKMVSMIADATKQSAYQS
jgi:hypothetical protein